MILRRKICSKNATNPAVEQSELSYDDWLKLLNLERLEIRRLRFDLLSCYKIIFGLVLIDREAFFELRTSCTRGHKLFKYHSRISFRSDLFAERVINAWNGLPADHIDFSSFPKFQRSPQHCVRNNCYSNDPLLNDCNWFICVSRSTISAVSAWLYLPFVLIVSSVFLPHVIMANKWLIDWHTASYLVGEAAPSPRTPPRCQPFGLQASALRSSQVRPPTFWTVVTPMATAYRCTSGRSVLCCY